jgi:hypothetical protein
VEGTVQSAPDPDGFPRLEVDWISRLPDQRPLQLVSRGNAFVWSSRIWMSAEMLSDGYRELLVEPIERTASFDQDLHGYRVRAGTEPVTRLRQRLATCCSLLLGKALLGGISSARF